MTDTVPVQPTQPASASQAMQPAGSNKLCVTLLSHPGASRTVNEDAATVGGLVLVESMSAVAVQILLEVNAPVVVAVADGLGGHAAGEVASSAAVHDLASGGSTLDSKEAVVKSLSDISEHITALANADRSRAGMATTIVGLAITPGHTFCFNVGDSPAFQLDGGYLTQVTTLDSPAQLAEDADDVAPTAVVTQVLGPASTRLMPHVHTSEARPGACHLLCSDGLSDLVPVAEMERLIADNAADDARAVRAMWAAAMNAGGSDNITIALVRRS